MNTIVDLRLRRDEADDLRLILPDGNVLASVGAPIVRRRQSAEIILFPLSKTQQSKSQPKKKLKRRFKSRSGSGK